MAGWEDLLPAGISEEAKQRFASAMGIPYAKTAPVVSQLASAQRMDPGNVPAPNPIVSPGIVQDVSRMTGIDEGKVQGASNALDKFAQSMGITRDQVERSGLARHLPGTNDVTPTLPPGFQNLGPPPSANTHAGENATFAPTPQAQQGPVVIPGKRTEAQWNVTEGRPVSEAVSAEFNQSDEEKKKAAKTGYDAGVDKANEQVGYFNRMQLDQMDREKEMRDRNARQRDAMQIEKHKLDTLVEKSQKGEEDQGAFLLPGALGSFVSAIGVAIGAASQAFTGSKENPGLALANAMVERNMVKQREVANKAKNAVDQQKTLLGNLRQQFGDETMAEEASYLAYLNRMKTEAMKIDAASLPKDAQARYQAFIAGLDGQIAERHMAFEDAAKDKVQRTDVMTQTRVLGGPGIAKPGDVHQYSEDLQKAKIPDAIASLKRIDEVMDQFGSGDIEGMGPGADARETLGKIAGYTPLGFGASVISGESPDALLLSKREQAFRQIRSTVENEALHALSGAAVTESEADRLMKGLRGANNAQAMRVAVDAIRTRVAENQRNIQAGSTPESVAEYKKRGGTITDVQRDKRQAPYVQGPK